jgi:aryl carrier-like protein
VGRRDEQVKIRGYRIELGEVEAALREQSGVKEAVAIAWVKESGDKQLVGYVVGEKGAKLTAAGLREGVGKKLPEYMVPMVVVLLEELPLTANGKVDRGKLPGPEEALGERGGEYVGPRDATEAILAEVWADALGLERVGMEENFFALGGDSILSVRIIGRARERGLEFSVQDLFEHQTVGALARVTRREGWDKEKGTAAFELVGEEVRSRLAEDVEDAYPLSRLQAGMLFHSDYAPESGVYHYIIGYRVHLPYEAETFQKAVERMTQRHEMLRTSIDMASFSEPMQLVHRGADLRVVEQDWRGKSEGEQEAALAEFMEGEYRTSFVWEQAPPMRMFVHRLKEDEFQCSFSFHHAIMDGWSEASLITELVQEYEGGLAGESLAVRRLGVSYRDYIALERGAMASQESIAFWKQLLEGHRATPVPLRDWRGEEKTAGQSGAEESGKVLVRVIALQEETQEQLQHLAREMGVPLKTVLLAAHMKALQVVSGQSDLTTGVAHNGRPEVEGGEQILGLFLNTVPFRLKLESGSWRQLIRETFAAEQRIVPHRRYPMVDLREQMGGEALFNTTFNYVHFHVYKERDGQDGQTLFAGRSEYTRTSLDFLVNFEVSPDTGKLRGTVHCDTGLMSAKALERIASYYGKILEGMREDQIGDVRPEEERSQIDEWNRTEAEKRDSQIKIRGYRVDLGEIEARLREYEGVREAVVVAREEVQEEKRLVAYYTVAETEDETAGGRVRGEELRAYLRQSLPEYMVPAWYVRLERLPLTENGKVDRKALPAPEGEGFAVRGYEAPEGKIETIIAGIWADVLKVERVGRRDDFFSLGGRSLLALQVIARLRQGLNVELTIRDVFERPTPSLLAAQIISLKLNAFDAGDLAQLLEQMQA